MEDGVNDILLLSGYHRSSGDERLYEKHQRQSCVCGDTFDVVVDDPSVPSGALLQGLLGCTVALQPERSIAGCLIT